MIVNFYLPLTGSKKVAQAYFFIILYVLYMRLHGKSFKKEITLISEKFWTTELRVTTVRLK